MNIKNVIFEELSKYYTDLSEDFPASFNKEEFYKLRSFAERIRYCSEHLPKIAAGSGRVVFLIDDKTVLKLAKNPKGVAQNLQEAQIGGDNYFKSIVAEVFDYDQDDKWIISEHAKKLTPTRFKELTGVDVKTAGYYLKHRDWENKPKRTGESSPFKGMISNTNIDDLHNNQFLADIVEMMFNYNIIAGDFDRLSSYGEVNREGQAMVVLVDYGLSDEVYNTHYARNYIPKVGRY